jgi:hypothetical protein
MTAIKWTLVSGNRIRVDSGEWGDPAVRLELRRDARALSDALRQPVRIQIGTVAVETVGKEYPDPLS